MGSMSTTVTMGNIEQTIQDHEIVLLDFWAAWCGPCRMFAPIFDKAAAAHPDLAFGKIDTEAERELAAGFRISSIPTLMAFRDGILVFSQPGALNAAQLEQVIAGIKDLDMEQVRAEVARQQAGDAGVEEGQ